MISWPDIFTEGFRRSFWLVSYSLCGMLGPSCRSYRKLHDCNNKGHRSSLLLVDQPVILIAPLTSGGIIGLTHGLTPGPVSRSLCWLDPLSLLFMSYQVWLFHCYCLVGISWPEVTILTEDTCGASETWVSGSVICGNLQEDWGLKSVSTWCIIWLQVRINT